MSGAELLMSLGQFCGCMAIGVRMLWLVGGFTGCDLTVYLLFGGVVHFDSGHCEVWVIVEKHVTE